jgi:hypothetical protein
MKAAERLQKSRVHIGGCGRLGTTIALALHAAGVRQISCNASEAREIAATFVSADWKRICGADGDVLPEIRYAVDLDLKQQFGYLLDPDGYDYRRELRGYVISAMGTFDAWKLLLPHIYCAVIGFTNVDAVLASKCLGEPGNRVEFIERLNLLIPSVRKLSWSEVMHLRKDARIKDFRRWYWFNTIEATPNDAGLQDEMIRRLWSAFGKLSVNVKMETMKGLFSNIPLPIPVNPLSIALSLKSVKDAATFQREYGWLLFILTAQSSANNL